MKTRQGFVSNSSSSSFVIITTQEKWNSAVAQLKEQVGENVAEVIIGEIGTPAEAKVLGKKALVFSGIISSEEYGSGAVDRLLNDGEITEEEADDLAMKAYEEKDKLDKILQDDGMSYVNSEGY